MKHLARVGALMALLAIPLAGHAQPGNVEYAEQLVRARYYEGLPYEKARELKLAGVERLSEMLRDSDEAQHHENIVMALGISGFPQAYAALVDFHGQEPEGELNAAEYRARRAIPLAMGHLARSDPRAFRFVLEAAREEDPESAPHWTYRHLRDERLAGVLRRAAITGVAMSGRPEAVAALRETEESARGDPRATAELRTHIGEAHRLHQRVSSEGPDQVFGGELPR